MTGPYPFSLRQLQYAVAVADLLNFRRAAERCRVAQPSLSAQIAALEGALGVQLFERDRTGVVVTRSGHEVVERARSILAASDDLFEAARAGSDLLAGTLTIGVIPTISPYLLPHVTAALRRAFPRLTLHWVEDKTETIVRRIAGSSLDGAILALEADLGNLDHVVLARDPFVLATPADHALGSLEGGVRLEDLAGADVLLLDDGHCLRDQALAVCEKANALELEFRATSLSTLVQMVAGGAGVTLLPRLAVEAETSRSGIKVRPFREPAPVRTIALAWRRTAAVAPALARVADAIRGAWPDVGRKRTIEAS